MGLFSHTDDLVSRAICSRQPNLRLDHCMTSADRVLSSALEKDPRLLAYLEGYHSSSSQRSSLSLTKDLNIQLLYARDPPDTLEQVVLDRGDWDPSGLLEGNVLQSMTLVTRDPERLGRQLDTIKQALAERYEGYHGRSLVISSIKKVSAWHSCCLTFDYLMPEAELRRCQAHARFAAGHIWKEILGRARVPDFAKPFLALSYLAQNTVYDLRALEEVDADPMAFPSDPIPHLAYGPLVEKRGICSGLAWAYKTLMDAANIECRCISGRWKDTPGAGHIWCLVKIAGQYYHVDPAWGIRDDRSLRENWVCVRGLLQPDLVFRVTHIWDTDSCPPADGMRYSYDRIEQYLAEKGQAFLDDGASEVYLFPSQILD